MVDDYSGTAAGAAEAGRRIACPTRDNRGMQFGTFDDENKEYVITRPDTPRSWSN